MQAKEYLKAQQTATKLYKVDAKGGALAVVHRVQYSGRIIHAAAVTFFSISLLSFSSLSVDVETGSLAVVDGVVQGHG